MAFHEKSAWVSLLSIAGVFVPYFVLVFQYPMAFIGLALVAVILLTILLTGFHIVNAIMTASIRKRGDEPPQDELDQLIELRAAKVSGFVLAFVVLGWCMVAAFGIPALGVSALANAETPNLSQFSVSVFDVLTAIHVLFAGFVASNIVYYGTIVAEYRKLMWAQP